EERTRWSAQHLDTVHLVEEAYEMSLLRIEGKGVEPILKGCGADVKGRRTRGGKSRLRRRLSRHEAIDAIAVRRQRRLEGDTGSGGEDVGLRGLEGHVGSVFVDQPISRLPEPSPLNRDGIRALPRGGIEQQDRTALGCCRRVSLGVDARVD